MENVPNLFRSQPRNEIVRLYSQYLGRLRASHRYARLLNACRRIRSYAQREGRPELAYFTYSFELTVLFRLRNFSAAWRQLRRWERASSGKNLDPRADSWTPEEINWFFYYHPYVLFFLGKYQPARRMLEAALENLIRRRREGMSYYILWHVYKPIVRPRNLYDVTLYLVYRKLGKNLIEWPYWKQFVKGFHPNLFRLARIDEEDLLSDPSLLRPFYQAIERERKQRLTAGISVGESEIVDSPSKVRSYQQRVARKIARLEETSAKSKSKEKIEQLFPELQRLSR